MFMHRRLLSFSPLVTLALITLALTAPLDGWARAVEIQGQQQLALLGPHVKQQKASNAAEAAKIAKRRYGGKILKVDTVKSGDGIRYRVKILQDDGRVKTVVIRG